MRRGIYDKGAYHLMDKAGGHVRGVNAALVAYFVGKMKKWQL